MSESKKPGGDAPAAEWSDSGTGVHRYDAGFVGLVVRRRPNSKRLQATLSVPPDVTIALSEQSFLGGCEEAAEFFADALARRAKELRRAAQLARKAMAEKGKARVAPRAVATLTRLVKDAERAKKGA